MFYVRSSVLKNVAMEVTATGGAVRAYVYQNGRVIAESTTDGQFYWLHTNHLNSARAMTDINGTLVYKGQFGPYGDVMMEWALSGNTWLNTRKFTGYERDQATGLDYANARMYKNVRGRFMQPDPIGLEAADTSPQSLNRYAYVSNDPINFSDPTGLIKCGDIGGDVGGSLSQHVNADTDRGKLMRYVWEEAGNLGQHSNNTDNLSSSQMLIAQAMMNRLDLANGRVGVFGKDGVFYWGNGANGNPGIRPVTQLGVGGVGTTMSQAIVLADAGVGAVDANGELNATFRNRLNNVLNSDMGDITQNAPGRLPVETIGGSTIYVTGECYSVIRAMQGTNTIYSRLLTLNTSGVFVTNWKGAGGISNPDPGRLFFLGEVGPNKFWGFQEFFYVQYPYPTSPQRTFPPSRPRISRGGGRLLE
ncbi:MAG: RHS repeat-associated core domain-containing protein [Blastocatellales bacterium]